MAVVAELGRNLLRRTGTPLVGRSSASRSAFGRTGGLPDLARSFEAAVQAIDCHPIRRTAAKGSRQDDPVAQDSNRTDVRSPSTLPRMTRASFPMAAVGSPVSEAWKTCRYRSSPAQAGWTLVGRLALPMVAR